MISRKVFLITALPVCLSCTNSQRVTEEAENQSTKTIPDITNNTQEKSARKLDESFDPRRIREDAWTIRSRYNASKQRIFTGYSSEDEKKALMHETKEYSVMGYRVQLFVSTNYYEALAARDSAATKLSEDIYFDYEQPYYKIRAGNFTERQRADDVRDRAKTLGYSDAWVVQTKVMITVN
jgi:hypothetical protein